MREVNRCEWEYRSPGTPLTLPSFCNKPGNASGMCLGYKNGVECPHLQGFSGR